MLPPFVGVAVKVTEVPAQILTPGAAEIITDGTLVGLTVIENVCGFPEQLFAVGVTVIVATSGVPPVLTALKDGIFPVPLAASPILGALFVQLKLVPPTFPLKLIALVAPLLQTI